MSDRSIAWFILFYTFGWLVDWSYWIADPWLSSKGVPEVIGAIMVGWMLAIFWPLHLFTKIWEWIL